MVVLWAIKNEASPSIVSPDHIICAMTALHTTVIRLAPQRNAPQPRPQRTQKLCPQASDCVRVRPAPFFTPVGLDGHLGRHPAQPQPTHGYAQKRHPVPRRNLTAERQKAQPRATFKESPLRAGEAMLAQVIPAFGTERACVGDALPIGLEKRKRFLALPRPVRGIEATAWSARVRGCCGVASEDVSDGVGGKVNALLGEVSCKTLASVVGFLVELQHTLLDVGVGFSGLAFGGLGQVVQSLLAVLLVAFDPLAHELWGGFASSCGFAVVLGLLVDVDDAPACLDGVHVVYLLIGEFHRWRASCCACCIRDSTGGAPAFFKCG